VDAYLSLTDVAKSYDGRQMAVADVTFEARKGEFITFLGPSGSGKTTTLMMISGFENPTAGTIMLDGRDITKTKPYKRNIGMVFQNYALFPHMTVRKNIAFPLRMRHMDTAEANRRVEEFLDLVHLSEHADKHPRELSGGQQQRVALARGLVFKPELLLLDEPSLGLAPAVIHIMAGAIRKIAETGVTVLLVEQNARAALKVADRAYVLEMGAVALSGAARDLLHDRRIIDTYLGMGRSAEAAAA
jgi:putative spermidine/putrescine transport system ATP-binding protein